MEYRKKKCRKINGNSLQWFQHILLIYFEEKDKNTFTRMIRRNNGKIKDKITDFCNRTVIDMHDWKNFILLFYKTEYKKTYYKLVYTTKKITRPLLPPRPESPLTPTSKLVGKTSTKHSHEQKADIDIEVEHGRDFTANCIEMGSQKEVGFRPDVERSKRKRSFDNKIRSQSPTTVIEMGPHSETEHIYQKVLKLVKKKKLLKQFHCYSNPITNLKYIDKITNYLCIMRKTTKGTTNFDTHKEITSEFPKYVIISSINTQDYSRTFLKNSKVLMKHIDATFTEPRMEKNVLSGNRYTFYELFNQLNRVFFPYEVFHLGTDDFFHAYHKTLRKINDEFKRANKGPCLIQNEVNYNMEREFTLKNVLHSPLFTMPEDLANLLYNIRQIKEIKELEYNEKEYNSNISPLKDDVKVQLQGLLNKMNWCRIHLESDLDIEISPWLERNELIQISEHEILQNKEIKDKIEKKLEIWGRYITNILTRCRAKKPKGSGPYGEYEYWFKREDQLSPLLLTFYGKSISSLISLLKKTNSNEANKFIKKRLLLKKYYETSKTNKDYIGISMYSLQKINTANDMEEIKLVIPDFWKHLRYLWLLSGYWAVKNNIIRFIERVQFLIVKKCTKVLEVNNYFTIPQASAKQLALDVIEVMKIWKNSFYEIKAYIETHQWEMRWEFPLHRIFNATDYVAKLAKDFCYLAEGLKHYMNIFSNEFAKVVQEEVVVDSFLQRVKLLIMPLKTADFNIYDPENDVHWNLLMETFMRDSNLIENESIHIINQSFKNLRSSVSAANLLLKYKDKGINKENKCYILLMSKFDFIILQIMKEIKLISELIVNTLPYSASYCFFHSKSSAVIYWIRKLGIYLQCRLFYLSHIREIRMTKTFDRALCSFRNFSRFYEICQLIFYVDWINIEKHNIRSQLVEKVFKLTPNESRTYSGKGKMKITINDCICDSQQCSPYNLLIKQDILLGINFDFHLCDIIMDINHMTKLGFILPRKFYSLAVLKEPLLDNFRSLNFTVTKYNSLMLNLRNEELLALKIFIYQLEHILVKGLNYYSWYTIKADNFCDELNKNIDIIYSYKEDVQNTANSIQSILLKIKLIDWFDFPGQVNETDFKTIKDFFEELELRRNKGSNEMFTLFAMINPLLRKMESLISRYSSGRNQYLVLFYNYFEEKILTALVINLLQNIKKFKKFLLGKEQKKFQLSLSCKPEAVFDFHQEQCCYFFMNSIDKLLLRYKMIPRWQFGSCWEEIKFTEFKYLVYKYNYLDDIIQFKIVATELIEVRQLGCMITATFSEFLSGWKKFRNLWIYDKESCTESFIGQERKLIEYCDVSLHFYDQFTCKLESCRDYVDLYCARIQIKRAKTVILYHTLEWKYILKFRLMEYAKRHIMNIHQRLSVISHVLTQSAHNLEEFQDVLQIVNDIKDFNCKYDTSISHINEIRYILVRHRLKFSYEDYRILNKVRYMLCIINKIAKYRIFLTAPAKKIYTKISLDLISDFATQCKRFAEVYFIEGPGTVGDNLDLGMKLMMKYKIEFDKNNSKKEIMIQAEQLLEQTPVSYDYYGEAFQEFMSLEVVFKLYETQKEARAHWAATSWLYFDSKQLTDGIDVFLLQFNQLPDKITNLAVAKEINKNMQNFKFSVSLMVKLKNNALKRRHWEELMKKTGHVFEMSPSKFTLNDLFLMNLHLHEEAVIDILGNAIRELSVEQSIRAINEYWSMQKFSFSVNDKQYIVTGIETIIRNLEEYCMDLQKMSNSLFAIPFMIEIKGWEEKLYTVYEFLTNWIILQNNLLNIRNIFQSTMIQSQISKLYKQFCSIHKQFSKIIKSLMTKPTIIEQCLNRRRLEEIIALSSHLEKCGNLLLDYVHAEKSSFPRFHLLSDDEVLSVLNATELENIQGVFPKIFHDVSSLNISFPETKGHHKSVTGMVSIQGETLFFKSHVLINKSASSWMSSVTAEMKESVKYRIKMAIYSYVNVKQSLSDWIEAHAGISIVTACKVWWTAEVEYIFACIKEGDLKAMKNYMNKLNYRKDELFLKIRSTLGSLDRMKYTNIFLHYFQAKSVVDRLVNDSVMSKDDFEWESQLRFYWKKTFGDLRINQCSGEFEYGYEYMGLAKCFIITPLTERIFLGLTQAFFHHFPAAITGPTSTGKTATVKYLSEVFGTFCIFINCSSLMDKKTFNKIFAALFHEGLWGCFNDFTKLDISVISMIAVELSAMRIASIPSEKAISVDGFGINFESKTQTIITSTMVFSNKVIPQFIKLLFRPISCVLPNIKEICHVILLSEGFSNAKILSKKITCLYEMAKNILFRTEQIVFNLRSLKSLLIMCGNFRKNTPDIEEDVIVMQSLCDINRSQLSAEDDELFMKLIKDIFINIDCPDFINSKLEKTTAAVWEHMGYIFIPYTMKKVIQTYEITKMRRFTVLVGPTGGGKTFIVTTLCSAQTSMGNHSKVIKIIPQAYSTAELYGYYNDAITKWSDGLFTRIFRQLNNSNEKLFSNYILFDGEINDLWYENLSLLMDDQKTFSLASCERISLSDNCFLIFEVGSLQNTAPGFVSHVGIVYVECHYLAYRPYWKRWTMSRIEDKERDLLNKYFEKYVPGCLNFVSNGTNNNHLKTVPQTVIPQTSLNLVVQLCFILDNLIPVVENENINLNKDNDCYYEKELESVFIQAIYLSLGACLSVKCKEIFDEFMKDIICFKLVQDTKEERATYGTLPATQGTLFEYNLDRSLKCWMPWEDYVNPYILNKCVNFDEIIVPTKDLTRMIWIMNLINHHNVTETTYKSLLYKTKVHKKKRRPILLIGESGVSKSTVLKEFSRHLNFSDYDQLHFDFSTGILAPQIQASLEKSLSEYTHFSWIPKENKKLIVFIDDLNMPKNVKNVMEKPSSLLKMLLEDNGMYTRDGNFIWKRLKDIYFFSAMNISVTTTHDDRFLSLFTTFYMQIPSNEVIRQIYTTITEANFNSFKENVREILPNLVLMTLKMYEFTLANLKPTPYKFHYIYNLRDLSRITQGIVQISPHIFKRPEQLLRVWRNEVTRVLWDRLVCNEEQKMVQGKMKTVLETFYPESLDFVMQDPLLFGDYRSVMQPDQPRDYEDLIDYEAIYHLFIEILQDFHRDNSNSEIVLFEIVLDHLTRIHRILRLHRGHAMIIGPVGSGKNTVARLASYTAGCKIDEFPIRKDCNGIDFIGDIKTLFRSIVVTGQKSALMITSHQIKEEGFLEIIENIMSSDEPLSIYNSVEKSDMINEILKHETTYQGITSRNQIWKQLQRKCEELFHIIILMTPTVNIPQRNCYLFSGLIKYATVDWMNSWPSESLYAIGRRFLRESDVVPERIKENIIEIIVYVHEMTTGYLRNIKGMAFQAYITPKHYLDLIKSFISLINKKNCQNLKRIQVLERGIKKFNEANEDLKVLNNNIYSQKSDVEKKELICKEFSSEMTKVSNEMTSKKNLLEEKRKEIAFLKKELTQQSKEVQIVLEKAVETIHQSIESIKIVDDEIRKISEQENHSEISFIIFECILILEGKTELNLNAVRNLLCEASVPSTLEKISAGVITIQQQKQVRGRLKRIAKLIDRNTVSNIESKFLYFVEVLLSYCNVLREIKPKQEKVIELSMEMDQAQNHLNSLQIEIELLETEGNSICESNKVAIVNVYQAQSELEVSFAKLEAANRLVLGLTPEHSRWTNELVTIHQEKPEIFGNSLMSATFLVYLGIFNYESRIELLQLLNVFVGKKNIPISPKFKIENELINNITLSQWIAEGLSNNEWSIHNALLFTHSTRVPLCIHPEEQTLNWILKTQDSGNMKVISYEDGDFQEQLEYGIRSMYSILIKDVDLIDPLTLNLIEGGHSKFLRTLPQENFISRRKIIFMITGRKDPNFDPVVYSQANVIDFSINKMELEDRLLDLIFEQEEKNFWNEREKHIIEHFTVKNSLRNLKENLVLKVGKTEYGLLENIQDIENLCEISIKIEEVQLRYEVAETALVENNKLRNTYKPVAKCASVLYFVLSEMCLINCMYEISLQLYFDMINYSLEAFKPEILQGLTLEERNESLQTYLKKFFYDFQSRGIFSQHQLLFSFKMALAFQKSYGVITQNEINFLLSNSKDNESYKSPFSWIPDEGWQNLQMLSLEFPDDFGDIINEITSNNEDWQKWFDVHQSEKVNFPHPYNKIKQLKKLMLLKCLDFSSVYNNIEVYISEAIGEEFNERPLTLLNEVFNQSSCKRPIIFISTPGTDPYPLVNNLASKYSNGNVLVTVSLGSEENEIHKNKLLEAVSKGLWITFQNCHFDTGFILEIYKVLQMVPEIPQEFRLCLIMEFSNKISSRVLKSSIKVTSDSPEGLKAKLRDMHTQNTAQYLKSSYNPTFKLLLNILTFFHCVLQERQKYGTKGWNSIYDFGNTDYHVAVQTIQMYLNKDIEHDRENVPWKTLNYLIGEIIYGGHVMDKYDRNIITCYIQEYFGDFKYSKSKSFTFHEDQNTQCSILPDENIYNYIDGIKELPFQNTLNIIGLHHNVDLWYKQGSLKMMCEYFLVAPHRIDTDSYISREEIVMNTSRKILQMLPSSFHIEEIKNTYSIPMTPVTTVLIQELEIINILIKRIFYSTTNLINAITGQIKMNEEECNMFISLDKNVLPIAWKPLTPETQKNLPNWMDYLLQRMKQYEKWICQDKVLPVMWLSGLYKPQSFLMALIQEASRKMEKPLENLMFCSNITNEYDHNKIQDPPEMGCYVKGLFLEGADWDSKKKCLTSLKPNILFGQLPVILILPIENFRCKHKNKVKIPVYTTTMRNSSGNGLIFEAELKSSNHISLCILQGVCMLLNND